MFRTRRHYDCDGAALFILTVVSTTNFSLLLLLPVVIGDGFLIAFQREDRQSLAAGCIGMKPIAEPHTVPRVFASAMTFAANRRP